MTSGKNAPSTAAANRQRIARTSAILRHVCMVMIIATIAIPAGFWALVTVGSALIPSPPGFDYSLTPLTRVLAFVVTLVPALLLVRAFLVLRRLFGLYEDGVYFGGENVSCFRQLGWTAIWWTVAEFIHGGALSAILTMNNPPGERAISLNASGTDTTALFAGVVLLLISWVMDEARRLDEDQAQIV